MLLEFFSSIDGHGMLLYNFYTVRCCTIFLFINTVISVIITEIVRGGKGDEEEKNICD